MKQKRLALYMQFFPLQNQIAEGMSHNSGDPMLMLHSSHLHIQLQDVCVRLQQPTQVWCSAAKVSMDKLFYVAVSEH